MAGSAVNLGGMLSSFLAQQKQPAPLSPRIGGLIDQAGRSLGGAVGGYATPDLSTAAGAQQAALQAQRYGHMQDYSTYMQMSQQLAQQEAQAALEAERQRAAAALQTDQQVWQSGENVLNRALTRDENRADRELSKWGTKYKAKSDKEITFMDAAFKFERLQKEIESREGMNNDKLIQAREQFQKQMDLEWEKMERRSDDNAADREQMAELAKLKLAASAKTRDLPSPNDMKALQFLTDNAPAEVRDKLYSMFKKGEREKLAAVMWTPVADGEDPQKVMELIASDFTYNPDLPAGQRWVAPE